MPNRRQRNQPSSRVHDIEFATEISTSLLQQVRNLQAMLNEKEEIIKSVTREKSRLEIEAEGFHQRLRSLDESEHRYKDENWNLETQIHEYIAQAKEAADREKRLNHSINQLQADKSNAQKELDDIKLSHAKLFDEHAASVKHHDLELNSAKRNMSMAENERGALQRRVDDLAGQNQELARAVAHQRGRLDERDQGRGVSDGDFETADDNVTPEHSPPPSPIKGTPRHSLLESETLKSSLHHAHRMIQSLKGNIHREKTEKLELKRMLQDARDELDSRRTEMGSGNGKRSRKVDSREFKKPLRPAQLGGIRNSRSETFIEDANWEEDDGQKSPSHFASIGAVTLGGSARNPSGANETESSDQFDTANETSDAAFETANERGTETEDFQTGVEEMSGSDELTETEGDSIFNHRNSALNQPGNRRSFQSTASNSGDEYSYGDLRTPQPQRLKLKVSRGGINRRSRNVSEEPSFHGSPASFASSNNGTPLRAGQSLFAELGNLSDEDESILGTPNRSQYGSPSATPASRPSTAKATTPTPSEIPPVPKIAMVDSSMMTEPWESEPATPMTAVPFLAGGALAGAAISEGAHFFNDKHASTRSDGNLESGDNLLRFQDDQTSHLLSVESQSGRPVSSSTYSDRSSQYDQDLMEEKLAAFPSPPTSHAHTPSTTLAALESRSADPLTISSIVSEHVEPKEQPKPEVVPINVPLSISSISSEHVEPREAAAETVPVIPLSMSSILSENVEPRELEPEVLPTMPLTLSSITSEHVEPREPEVAVKPIIPLTFSSIASEHFEPKEAEAVPFIPVPMSMSSITSEHFEPKELKVEAVPAPAVVPLSFSSVSSEHIEPRESVVEATPFIPLSFSSIASEHVEPKESKPEVMPIPDIVPLTMSSIVSEHVEPKEVVPQAIVPLIIPLTISSIVSEHIEPIELEERPEIARDPPEPVPAIVEAAPQVQLSFSSIQTVATEPIEAPSPPSSKQDALLLSRNQPEEMEVARPEEPETPKANIIGSVFGWNKKKSPATPIIAEDDTRQSLSNSPVVETPESQRPFRELSSNTNERSPKKTRLEVNDESSQTALTSDQIDNLLKTRAPLTPNTGDVEKFSAFPFPSRDTAVLGGLKMRTSQDSIGSVSRARSKMADPDFAHDTVVIKRPTSAGSGRNNSLSSMHPPLPTDHKQVIAAAAHRTGSSNGGPGSMGPPLFPASATAHKINPSFRPRTPSSQGPLSPTLSSKGGPTPRPLNSASGHADVYSPTGTASRSRKSSVSSFASEIETRFNMRQGMPMPVGLDTGTDPRMINAITQTMIGEYLWKYTRKAGRGAMSENRHRRYFWVHPYTRTLYWSDKDPSSAGRAELKAKSVPIEAVRVVTDDNPMPPGLHRKSLVIMTPGRNVKFTATTGQRHETWFNALSYLLLRTGEDAVGDTSEVANGALTSEDVAEFNPGFGNNSTRQGRASLSSYNSRTTRNTSPPGNTSRLSNRPADNSTASRPTMGTLSRLSNYWKPSSIGSFSSRRSRQSGGGAGSFYEASEVHDSAEDLREMIEKQDRESDRLENVRACCDGKC